VLIWVSLGILLTDGMERFNDQSLTEVILVEGVEIPVEQNISDKEIQIEVEPEMKVQEAGFNHNRLLIFQSGLTLDNVNSLLERLLIGMLLFAAFYFSLWQFANKSSS